MIETLVALVTWVSGEGPLFWWQLLELVFRWKFRGLRRWSKDRGYRVEV